MARKSYTVTVDAEISEKFKEKCKDSGLNQSMLIDAFMKAFVNDEIEFKMVKRKSSIEIKE